MQLRVWQLLLLKGIVFVLLVAVRCAAGCAAGAWAATLVLRAMRVIP